MCNIPTCFSLSLFSLRFWLSELAQKSLLGTTGFSKAHKQSVRDRNKFITDSQCQPRPRSTPGHLLRIVVHQHFKCPKRCMGIRVRMKRCLIFHTHNPSLNENEICGGTKGSKIGADPKIEFHFSGDDQPFLRPSPEIRPDNRISPWNARPTLLSLSLLATPANTA